MFIEHGGHHGHSHGITRSNNKLAQLANTDDNENNSFVFAEGVCIYMAFTLHNLFPFFFFDYKTFFVCQFVKYFILNDNLLIPIRIKNKRTNRMVIIILTMPRT